MGNNKDFRLQKRSKRTENRIERTDMEVTLKALRRYGEGVYYASIVSAMMLAGIFLLLLTARLN